MSWFPCFVLFGHPNSAQLTEPPLCHAAGSCAFTHAAPWCQLTGHLPSLYVFSFRFYDSHDWSFAHTNIAAIEIGLPDQSGGRRWSNSLPRTSIICAPAWKSGTLFPHTNICEKIWDLPLPGFHPTDSIERISKGFVNIYWNARQHNHPDGFADSLAPEHQVLEIANDPL